MSLLQMAVFPFIVQFAAAHGLGACPATALRLLRSGWPLFVLAWGGTLAAPVAAGSGVTSPAPAVVITADQGRDASQWSPY
jgi:hypothetical protein